MLDFMRIVWKMCFEEIDDGLNCCGKFVLAGILERGGRVTGYVGKMKANDEVRRGIAVVGLSKDLRDKSCF